MQETGKIKLGISIGDLKWDRCESGALRHLKDFPRMLGFLHTCLFLCIQ